MNTRWRQLRSKPWAWAAALALLATALLAGLGCYPGEINSIEELDLVITHFDSTHVWAASNSTFYLADSVVHLTDTADASNNLTLSRAYDSLVLAETAKGLLGYGYTQVDSSQNPDYYVVVSAMAVKTWTVDVWYPYYPCCWYGGGWGWYYPYYPYYDVDSYETGTVFLDMYDRAGADSLQQLLPRPWLAVLNGLMGTTSSVTQARLQTTIRQAYAQSPYLKPQ
jgi:hypothetical protein